jgi:hypothetical protein
LNQRSRKPISNEKRVLQKDNPCISNHAKKAVVPRNIRREEDSEFRWYISPKDKDPEGFLPSDEIISLVNSDIRDDASLL